MTDKQKFIKEANSIKFTQRQTSQFNGDENSVIRKSERTTKSSIGKQSNKLTIKNKTRFSIVSGNAVNLKESTVEFNNSIEPFNIHGAIKSENDNRLLLFGLTSNKKHHFQKNRIAEFNIERSSSLFEKKKLFLFIKRKLFYYKNEKFKNTVVIRVKANNIFCTLINNLQKKTIFSCAASRYNIKITTKRLKYEIARMLTFFYHDIKAKIQSRYLIIKIISPKYLRVNVYQTTFRLFNRIKKKTKLAHRVILYQLKDYKAFNGCRKNKKRRKKRRRSKNIKKG